MRHAALLFVVVALVIIWEPAQLRGGQQRVQPTPAQIDAIAKQAIGDEGTVCSATLLQSASGAPTMLASVDYSGRRFCNTLVRVRAAAEPVVLNRIETWMIDRTTDAIQDLDGDGELEIVARKPFSPYEGAQACVAAIDVVYRCADRSCVEATASDEPSGHFVARLTLFG